MRHRRHGMSLMAASLFVVATIGRLGRSTPSEAAQPTDPKPGNKHMIQYAITLSRKSYFPGEEALFRVQITNQGSAPIQLPDPKVPGSAQLVHILKSPAYPEGTRLGSAGAPSASGGSAANPPLITIAPGASWNGSFALDRLANLSQPGEYRLQSKLDWQDVKAESQEVSFAIRPIAVRSVHVGLGVRPFDTGEGEGAFLHAVEGTTQLFTFNFKEMRPAIGEAVLGKPIFRLDAGANATEVAIPWRNTPFFNEMLRYVLWREDQTVKLISSTGKTPFSFLPSDGISRMVRPPLKTTGGPIEVGVFSKDGNALQWIQFDPKSGVGSIAWKVTLPATAQDITAALGPEAGGSKRYLAFTARSGSGVDLYYTHFAENGLPEPFQHVHVDGWGLLSGAAPAILAEADGVMHIMLPVTGKSEGVDTCALIEIQVPADGKAPVNPHITNLGKLPGHPVAGAALLVDKDGRVARRAFVIVLEGEEHLLKLSEAGSLVPVSVHGTPTTPILLAPGKNANYIIFSEPQQGLVVEAF